MARAVKPDLNVALRSIEFVQYFRPKKIAGDEVVTRTFFVEVDFNLDKVVDYRSRAPKPSVYFTCGSPSAPCVSAV